MCPHEEKLTAWLLGDLSPEEHQALTRHLETCASCRSVREELSRVLTPLRSGLEKDRHLRISRPPAAEPSLSAFRAFWSTPNEGLRRVAILTLSFGTLFAFIGVIYQSFQSTPAELDSVTYVSYLQTNEAPPPALAPAEELRSEAAKGSLSESAPHTERQLLSPTPVDLPAVPAPEPQKHAFRKLVKADAEPEQKQRSLSDAAPAAPAAAAAFELPTPAAKPSAKRERAKAASVATPRPPADLMTKPVRLAGAVAPATFAPATLAPTNAVSTNAIPTNAVAPAKKQQP
jgi:pyruvate/2-oxoglutarate dehydrogenase complex dihydrolipoamide acyltransferase (E2) component